ncbi:MAG TPA: SIMPL domain-containing protein [Gemmatimonadaceae bacterium]|nr:SIMPL domain-containing protein [Gemmatimonadaceae bacterium]
MQRITRHFVSAALIGAASVVLVPGSAHAQGGLVPTPALVTSGQGEAKVAPDRASLLVNVQTRGATAASAASENAQKTRAVLDALAKLGLPREQLGTEGYTVYPELRYDKDGGSPKVTGYVVTNTVKAETHRVEQAGAMIDAALGAGANMINSLSFYASSIDVPRREAIGLAVASARADAEAMARAAGGTLGTLLEMSTQGPTSPPRPMFDTGMMRAKVAQAEPTPVNPGLQTVNVFVTARWQFVPGR